MGGTLHDQPARSGGLRRLSLLGFERRWLLEVFASILPAHPGLATGAADVPLRRFVDDFVIHAPLQAVLGLRAALWLVLLAPPFVLGRWRTFLGLAPAVRLILLDRLRRSDRYLVRESATLFKVVGALGFCGLAPLQQRIGIQPVDATPPTWMAP
jgi:hypothetical protein